PTRFVSDTMVQAAVPYANVAAPTTANITVFNPTVGGGGGVSNAVPFVVTNAQPVLSGLTPTSVTAGGPDFGLVVQGEGFCSASLVTWNGSPRVTTFNAHNALTVKITAADIATAGSAQVVVVNPTPGGGASAPLTLTI